MVQNCDLLNANEICVSISQSAIKQVLKILEEPQQLSFLFRTHQGCISGYLLKVCIRIGHLKNFNQPLSIFPSGNWLFSLHYHLAYLEISQICLVQQTSELFHWYCYTVQLKYLTLKVVRKAWLYHQVTSNDHVISNA